VYGSIETMISYIQGKKKTTLFVGIGLGLLGLGEFIAWYSFVFPETVLYIVSIIVKISGLTAVGIPVSKIPLRKISFDENLYVFKSDRENALGSQNILSLLYIEKHS